MRHVVVLSLLIRSGYPLVSIYKCTQNGILFFLVEANRDKISACQKAVSGQEKIQKPYIITVPAQQK